LGPPLRTKPWRAVGERNIRADLCQRRGRRVPVAALVVPQGLHEHRDGRPRFGADAAQGHDGPLLHVFIGVLLHDLDESGDGLLRRRADLLQGAIVLAAVSADGGTLLTVTAPDGGRQPQLWRGGQERPLAPEVREALAEASAPALAPDGRLAAVGDEAGGLSLWDLAAGKKTAAPGSAHRGRIEAVGFAADGKTLASAGADRALRLWDLPEDGIVERPLRLPAVPDVILLEFSPDGRHLAAVSSRWAGEQTRHGRAISPPTGKVDGTLQRDDVVRVWDLAAAEERAARTVRGRAHRLTFSPDGRIIVVAGSEKDGDHEYGVVGLWDPATGQDVRGPFTGHAGRVECVAFAPDGKTLAAGDRDGQVKLWNPATGQEKVVFLPGAGPVLRVAFARDGTALSAVSERGAVHSWRAATPADVVRHAERAAAAAVPEAQHRPGGADSP
jgi:hypothetical protein